MSTTISQVADKTFDYVVVGGGTAGLALASRLSEDPSVTVVVLEAGGLRLNDPNIDVPAISWGQMGDPMYDWLFKTTPQAHCNDRELAWNRGRVLGGSSAMNMHSWMTPPAHDMDMVEKLGNPGWSWKDFAKYYKRAETFHPANKKQVDKYPHEYVANSHGTSGPIQTTVMHHSATIDNLYQETVVGMGMRKIKDPYAGDITGTWISHGAVNPDNWTRSYAIEYYKKSKDRSNYLVLTEAEATRVLFDDTNQGAPLRATGVEFIHGGQKHIVKSSKEVTLCAGSIKDPQILELSGLGRLDVLNNIGVDVKLELPGVGENVQEHVMAFSTYELNDKDWGPLGDLRRDPHFAEKAMKEHAEGKGMPFVVLSAYSYFTLDFCSPKAEEIIKKIEVKVRKLKESGTLPPGLAEQYDIQLSTLRNPAIPDCEIIPVPGLMFGEYDPSKYYMSMTHALNHPFSRGSIHAKSKNPQDHPEINPRYFEFDFDLELIIEGLRFSRRMLNYEPMKSGVLQETFPGSQFDTNEHLGHCVKNTLSTVWHTVGSCSMLPKDKQGVVGPDLIVYGTKNLRVADLAVIPLHIAAHTQATAYAIGEKAADLILRV